MATLPAPVSSIDLRAVMVCPTWRSLGLMRGFAREPGGAARWRHHGQPKETFVFELTDGATEALSRAEMPALWNAEQSQWQIQSPRFGTTRRAKSADFNAATASRSPSSTEITIQPGIADSRSYRMVVIGSSSTLSAATLVESPTSTANSARPSVTLPAALIIASCDWV